MKYNVLKSDVESWLDCYFKGKGSYNKRVYEAMDYSLKAGGKRIRPVLFLLSYCLYKKNYSDVIPIACALEMIHTYSLIHDDLPCMDNDDLRRGKPTNHKVFGFPMALLAGDGLLNEAMNVMFDYCTKNNTQNAINSCSMISHAAGTEGMIGGQVVDMLSENRKISEDELFYMHKKKTGALIKTSIVAGAVLGGADKSDIELLSKYGDDLGLVFQIKDDILNVTGDEKKLGKSVGSDAENNKTNFITVYGLEECREKCLSITDECIEVLSKLNRDVSDLIELTKVLLDREN